MGKPDDYRPRPGSGIIVRDAYVSHVPPIDDSPNVTLLQDALLSVSFPGGTPGPNGFNVSALLEVVLQPNESVDLNARVADIVTGPEGIGRSGVLFFFAQDNHWQGPYDPHHDIGWGWFEPPGLTGSPSIRSFFKNWSASFHRAAVMKVFIERHG